MSTVLETVAVAADEVADDQRRVARRARAMQRQRDRGWSWVRILDREEEPGLLGLLRGSVNGDWPSRRATWPRASPGDSPGKANHGVRSPGVWVSHTSGSRRCFARTGNARMARTRSATGSNPMNLEFAVCLPRDAETVALVRGVVANALSSFGVTPECVEDIRLALSEACTNVIDHAAADDEYEVRLEEDEERCAISIKNTGSGFDATALVGLMPDSSSPRGRGVAIMRAVMDRVEFSSESETGTIVHLVKMLGVEPAAPLANLRRRRRQM